MTLESSRLKLKPIVVSNTVATLSQLVFAHFLKPLSVLNNSLDLSYVLLLMFYLKSRLYFNTKLLPLLIYCTHCEGERFKLDKSKVCSSMRESSSRFRELTVDNIPSSDL